MRRAVIIWLLIASGTWADTFALRGATMGTTYQIKLVAKPSQIDTASLHTEVEQALVEIDQQMSTYRPGSELSRFNRAPAGQWFAVSSATVKVVTSAQEISEKTSGALDVTVGPLVRLWHFGPAQSGDVDTNERAFVPPPDDKIAEAKARVGYQKLRARAKPPALRKDVEGLEVDLSSIAPGYAIDRLAELLEKSSIGNFMVELGGEVRAAGRREDGKPWRIGVEQPSSEGRALHSSVSLDDAAIATAGDYRKFFEYKGRRYSHVIDPATGRPVEHSLASVTVVADSCIAADGWDTPLLVLGAERGFDCAEKHGIAALFISRGEEDMQARATTAWKSRNDP